MARSGSKKKAAKKVEKAVKRAVKKGVTSKGVERAVLLGMAKVKPKKPAGKAAAGAHEPEAMTA